MSKAQDKFDGLPVEFFDGRFSGSFDIDESIGKEIGYDDVVCFVVVGTANKAGISQNKAGELKRTNVFKVTNAKVVNGNTALKILGQADIEVPGITPPEEYHGGDAFVDPDSGEIYGLDADEDEPYWLKDEVDDDDDDEPELPFVEPSIVNEVVSGPIVIRSSDPALNSFLEGA